MSQGDEEVSMEESILPWQIHSCPFEHNEKCARKWNCKFIDHQIICYCNCHQFNKGDLK